MVKLRMWVLFHTQDIEAYYMGPLYFSPNYHRCGIVVLFTKPDFDILDICFEVDLLFSLT